MSVDINRIDKYECEVEIREKIVIVCCESEEFLAKLYDLIEEYRF